jgi:TonB-linked SusC/RagA family outer membrane protein
MFAALLSCIPNICAQKTLTGQVVDSNGEPVIGALVRITGTDAKSSTNLDGYYFLNNIALDSEIEIANIGYAKKKIKYQGQDTINVVLTDSRQVAGKAFDSATGLGFAGVRISVAGSRITAMSSDDGSFVIETPDLDVTFLVEAPGYYSQTVALKGKSQIDIFLLQKTGASAFYDETAFKANSQVSVSDFSIHGLSVDEDINSSLNGQARTVAHSGTPANGQAMFIRGFHSLNASSQPLYVVDGIIWQPQDVPSIIDGLYLNPLSVIDPEDVEKITVLKNGTSLYGSKGANGVILIDTKRSKSPATSISLDLGMSYRAPFSSMPLMNAGEYRIYASDILSGKYDKQSLLERLKFLDDNTSKSYYNANHNTTDWLGLMNKGAYSQNYGIRVEGGDDVALYAVSLGYVQSAANVPNTGFDRLNFRVNSDIFMSKQFKTSFDVAFTQTNSRALNDGIDSVSAPLYLAMIKSPVYSPYEYDLYGNQSQRLSNYDELGVGNPLSLTENGLGQSKQYALNVSLLPAYTFKGDKVKAKMLFSYGWRKLNENQFIPDLGIIEQPLLNAMGEIYGESQNFVQDRMTTHTSIIADAHVEWEAIKNETNDLSAFGGYRFHADSYKGHLLSGHNTGSDNLLQLSNTQSYTRTTIGIDDNWRSMSWYAVADYAYRKKYLVNVSAATDLSSRFGKNVGWGIFPSVSGGWIISSEKFMKNIDFINFLKITAAYDVSGNDNIPNSASRTYFSASHGSGLLLENIGNPDLQWETTATTSAGLNFSMFNNRWTMNVNLYSSRTYDLLIQKQLNDIAGVKYYWSNGGELQNNGLEIKTGVRVLNMRNLKLDCEASIGNYKNKIVSLADGSFVSEVAGAQILTQVGQPAGVFFGYKTQGVFSTADEALDANLSIRNKSGQLIPFEAGDMHFAQVVDDGVIDDKDRQIIGDPNPDFYGSFNFRLSWKRLTFEAMFNYTYGNDVYNALRANLEAGSNSNNQTTAMQNRWVVAGQKTDIPRAVYDDPTGNSRFSDRWIEDGSFLRFKSLVLAYKLPFQMTFLQEISIWASINNIFTLTKYLGNDPESAFGNSVLYQGIDAGLIPQTRSYSIGIKINL